MYFCSPRSKKDSQRIPKAVPVKMNSELYNDEDVVSRPLVAVSSMNRKTAVTHLKKTKKGAFSLSNPHLPRDDIIPTSP